MPKANDVVSTNPGQHDSTQNHFAEIYRQIGTYFINNADRLGNNVVDGTSGIDIFISLEPNSIVSIDILQKEVLVKQGLFADATIGKLQVEPELNWVFTNKVNGIGEIVKKNNEKKKIRRRD